jgi:V/A-type H+-transporting ATPase subunit K
MGFILTVAIILVMCTVGIGLTCTNKAVKGRNAKKLVGMNVTALVGIVIVATIIVISGGVSASAADTAQAASVSGLKYIGAALAIGLSAIGSGIAVASSSAAALGALSEDPKIFGKAFVFVGLAEGIAIYGLIISILILNA